jgi:hypothetical protein
LCFCSSAALAGHTSESLEALGVEIVVTFEGTSELGDTFMTRQSYLPSEIHWGCTFVNIIQQAASGQMQHSINLSRWAVVREVKQAWLADAVCVGTAYVVRALGTHCCEHHTAGGSWPDAAQHISVMVGCLGSVVCCGQVLQHCCIFNDIML